jgi:hypothetical protein
VAKQQNSRFSRQMQSETLICTEHWR